MLCLLLETVEDAFPEREGFGFPLHIGLCSLHDLGREFAYDRVKQLEEGLKLPEKNDEVGDSLAVEEGGEHTHDREDDGAGQVSELAGEGEVVQIEGAVELKNSGHFIAY